MNDNSESDDTASVSTAEWRKTNKIVLVGATKEETSLIEKAFPPYRSFKDCRSSISEEYVSHCENVKKFSHPTPIQAQCWSTLSSSSSSSSKQQSSSRDVVGIAETGSGKTLAFALPMLSAMHRYSKKQQRSPFWPQAPHASPRPHP